MSGILKRAKRRSLRVLKSCMLKPASELLDVGFDFFLVGREPAGFHEFADLDGGHFNAILF